MTTSCATQFVADKPDHCPIRLLSQNYLYSVRPWMNQRNTHTHWKPVAPPSPFGYQVHNLERNRDSRKVSSRTLSISGLIFPWKQDRIYLLLINTNIKSGCGLISQKRHPMSIAELDHAFLILFSSFMILNCIFSSSIFLNLFKMKVVLVNELMKPWYHIFSLYNRFYVNCSCRNAAFNSSATIQYYSWYHDEQSGILWT